MKNIRLKKISEPIKKFRRSIACYGVQDIFIDKLDEKHIKYLICNGYMMGKWTSIFGANCIADTYDCIEYAKKIANSNPHYELFEIRVNVY